MCCVHTGVGYDQLQVYEHSDRSRRNSAGSVLARVRLTTSSMFTTIPFVCCCGTGRSIPDVYNDTLFVVVVAQGEVSRMFTMILCLLLLWHREKYPGCLQ